MTETIRIVLIDDHVKVHHGIAAIIDVFDDLVLVGQGGNGNEAIELCERYQPDIVLMDVVMPQMDGIEATRIIKERLPKIKVLALSSFQDEESIRAMVKARAIGYILKNSTIDDLAYTIRAAHTEKAVFSMEVAQILLDESTEHPTEDFNLTAREFEVLREMVAGKNNQQIADDLNIGLSTVKYHVSNILSKLNVSSRIEAVAIAIQKKLVT